MLNVLFYFLKIQSGRSEAWAEFVKFKVCRSHGSCPKCKWKYCNVWFFIFTIHCLVAEKMKERKRNELWVYLFFIGRWENFVVWEAKSNPMGCSSIGTSSFCLRSFVYFIFFCFWCVSLVLFSEEPNGVLVIEPKKKSLHDFVLFDLNRRRGRCLWSQLWRRINLVWIISQAIRFLRALCFREGSCLVLLGNFKWTWESWCFPILLSILR